MRIQKFYCFLVILTISVESLWAQFPLGYNQFERMCFNIKSKEKIKTETVNIFKSCRPDGREIVNYDSIGRILNDTWYSRRGKKTMENVFNWADNGVSNTVFFNEKYAYTDYYQFEDTLLMEYYRNDTLSKLKFKYDTENNLVEICNGVNCQKIIYHAVEKSEITTSVNDVFAQYFYDRNCLVKFVWNNNNDTTLYYYDTSGRNTMCINISSEMRKDTIFYNYNPDGSFIRNAQYGEEVFSTLFNSDRVALSEFHFRRHKLKKVFVYKYEYW